MPIQPAIYKQKLYKSPVPPFVQASTVSCSHIGFTAVHTASRMEKELLKQTFFRSTEKIKKEHPQIPAFETYAELLDAIQKALEEKDAR